VAACAATSSRWPPCQPATGKLPEALEWPGLNEYDGEALVRAIHSGPAPDAHTPEGYRQHFPPAAHRTAPAGWPAAAPRRRACPAYADWVAGIMGALDHVRSQPTPATCSSSAAAGPSPPIVGQVLDTSRPTSIELNMRIRNSALTELAFTPRRYALVAFNHLPHLDSAARREWVTYS
jgi:hypothetical protein